MIFDKQVRVVKEIGFLVVVYLLDLFLIKEQCLAFKLSFSKKRKGIRGRKPGVDSSPNNASTSQHSRPRPVSNSVSLRYTNYIYIHI